MLMQDEAPGESSPALFSLLWSVQGSLLSWCYLQLKGSEPCAKKLATEMVERCESEGWPQSSMGLGRGKGVAVLGSH